MQITLTGFHAIEEATKNAKVSTPSEEFKLFYNKQGPRVKKILSLANEKKLSSVQVSKKELDTLVKNLPPLLQDHRGLVLVFTQQNHKISLEEFLQKFVGKKLVTLALLSNIIDPHNVGAILRSADQFSVDGIIVSERKSAGDLSTIAKISSGASQFVPIIEVKNLNRASETLKDNGFWLYGADLDGEPLPSVDFAERSCIVLGSEGKGIAVNLKNKMDKIITIPTSGKLDSLNVSNAAAVIFYERVRNLL
ncbi:MAG: 23S rRNA (guanosine(2251)-2'-O)-methyltransferase RlmB [Treponemataceae bacterium]